MKKRLLSILLTLCMVLCIVPTGVFAEGEKTKKVETEQELVDALADSTVDIITLKSDIAVGSTLIVKRAVTLDIYGYMLEISGTGSVIKVEDGGYLTLEDSDLTATYYFTPNADGLWKWGISGTKTVCGGVIYGGKANDGGGVYVESGGRFTMNGGSIVGCSANDYGGGGVYVSGDGVFEMNDGATIIGCVTLRSVSYGGGVYIASGGTFIMNGGAIRDCKVFAFNGGGVCSYGQFDMNGGTIRDCLADSGSAIYHDSSDRLTLNGTIISDNSYGEHQPIFVQTRDEVPVIIGADADIQANIYMSAVTLRSNGGVVRGDLHVNYSITITVDEGVSHGTIFYGKLTASRDYNIDCAAVTYKANGEDYATQFLRSGAAATKLDDPTNDGYVFVGWFGGDTPYDFTSPVTGDITLIAKWAKLVDKTADFTVSDGGAAAIALLNSAKTGAENSVWDNSTKTLTLKGVSMATTATTAVKLPDGAKVILADGTENRIIGGGAAVAQDRTYQSLIYIYGIYAAGKLTIKDETNGTGTLFVNSGDHINSGNARAYSVAVYADGDLTVNGGAVTAQGGKTSSADCAFSLGVQLSEGHSLSVSGGTLTAIGGESFDTGDPNDVDESFSEGIYTENGNVTVSGSGKLIVETVPSMADKFWFFGLHIVSGSLTIKGSASVSAATCRAVKVYDGDIILMGGKLSAFATSYLDAVSVTGSSKSTAKRNIEISGGTFECVGNIEMSHSPKKEGTGVLSVTGGKLTAGRISGADTVFVSGGSVTSGRIDVNTVELQSGSLAVREPVYKYEQINRFYAFSAFYCKNLIVSGGTLDAAWDWGEYTPIVFSWSDPDPLIKMINGTASFGGGTVILDTGCAGNTALKVGTLNLSGGVRGSGYTNEDGSDTYLQKYGSTPVKFTVYPADYGKVDAAIKKANALNKDEYKDFSAVEAAINAVVRGKNLDEQAMVDAMAKAIEDAIAALEYKDADYSKVNEAIKKANALNKDEYKDFSAVEAAIDAVVRDKNITEQSDVDTMAKAINDAIAALEYKEADYTKVNEAITKADTLNKDDYKDFSAVEAAIDAVVRGKNITEQTAVDEMAKVIEDSIAALEYKDADYSKVDEAIAKADALNKDDYKDFSVVQSAINAVVRGKNITEQADVDAMAKAIEDAINALEKKPAETKTETVDKSPRTGDNSSLMLWIALFFISGGATVAFKKKIYSVK